jgi:integrase
LGAASRITDYLKTLSRYHRKTKAPAFSREQIFEYLRTAPSDGTSLVNKLVLLCGFYGGMRSSEITARRWEDVTFAVEGILINIATSKTDRAGIGSLKLLPKLNDDMICSVYYFNCYKQATCLNNGRLFLHFRNGKFINSPLGKISISAVPEAIARFLNLENPKKYTGHSMRVSSATVLADNGANTLTLKRHGRWASESVAEEYVRQSKAARNDVASLLSGETSILPCIQNLNSKQATQTNVTFENCVFNGNVVLATTDNVENCDSLKQ